MTLSHHVLDVLFRHVAYDETVQTTLITCGLWIVGGERIPTTLVISTAAMLLDSISVFDAAIRDLSLDVLKPKFTSDGWTAFADFAYCTPDVSGRDTAAFEKVVDGILEADGSQKHFRVKLHRLYAHAFQAATLGLSEALEAKDRPPRCPCAMPTVLQRRQQ